MKAIGINALVLDDNCDVICREGTMVKAVLNKEGQVSYNEILNFNTLSEIKEFPALQDFIEDLLNAARSEFGDEFNSFEITGIDDNNNHTWIIRCTPIDGDVIYTFDDYSDKNIRFIETLVKEN